MSEPVAVLGGSGALGFGLAVRLAACGVPVVIGSREGERGSAAAERVRELVPAGRVTGTDNVTAAEGAGFVVLSVPFSSQAATVATIAPHLSDGQLVVDATVPLATAVGGRATRMLGVWQGSAAQQAQQLVPDTVPVVSALHTVSAAALSSLDEQLDEDVLIAGDRKRDKERVSALIGRIEGLRCVDCGPLENSRITESLTSLLIGINGRYKTHAGIRITGLPA
ncbi:MAG: NADPH-dependent reductase [Acidimicrobiales bacterium]|nr:NADPH-dependent reductase [Acidimicrobiales bacterium]